MSIHSFSIIRIIEKALDYVDPRLMNHGKHVAYLTYRVLKKQSRYNEGDIHKMLLVALLHDIGAYKTEEIDKMLRFETQKVWEHSVYGYLFIKYFSPLPEMAPAILFHHTSYDELEYLHPHYRGAAQIINISDRFDVFLLYSGKSDMPHIKLLFEAKRGKELSSDILDLFFMGEQVNPLIGIESDKEFHEILYGRNFSSQEIDDFIKMLVLSIDFRSPQTVLHTFSAAYTCKAVSKILNIDPGEQDRILTGMMLHDIGKIGIPGRILNKKDKLTSDEMAVIKKHVEITEDILSGEVEKRVLKLAVRHHEKLDGSGYPMGLNAASLTRDERLIAIADIFSALTGTRSYKDPFPKSKVVDILESMALAGQIDQDIVSVFIANYDGIITEVDRETAPITEAYERLTAEYEELTHAVNLLGDPIKNEKEYEKNDSALSRRGRKHAFWTSLTRPNPTPVHLDFYRDKTERCF